MGSQSNKDKKKKKRERTTGQRKTAKEKSPSPALDPPLPRPQPRPLARIILRGPEPPRDHQPPPPWHPSVNEESDAVHALVAMAGDKRRQALETQMDHVFAATVPGVSVDELRKERERAEQEQSDSEKKSSEDDSDMDGDPSDSDSEELADAVQAVSSPISVWKSRPKFVIPFEVPYNGATRDLEISSKTPFDTFLNMLATRMETRKSLLSGIAYIPSYAPKTPKPVPKLLEDEEGWRKLVDGVEAHIAAARANKKAKGVVKPFSIRISDTSGADSKAGTGGKKGSKKDAAAISESPALPEDKGKKFYRELEQKYQCAEHDRACVVLEDGNHYHLTEADLAKWAYLISEHKATKETLPRKELKIDDAAPRQHNAKKAMARHGQPAASSDSSEPPQWVQSLLPFVGMAMGSSFRNNSVQNPFVTPTPALRNQPTPGSSRQFHSDPPSSGTKRAASEAAPCLDDWLRSLDDDPGRGRHGQDFYGYCAKFKNNDMYDLTDLEELTSDELVKLLDCSLGVAKRLVKYAKEDLDSLAKKVKRARH
ncbi:hypothetical protein C8R45DRAFT_1220539 [Mycena sanguinolenta]|nr:hypothetical protein C8R45DRAFT_1220539 [Mycena sanguinolenta]